ncbi:hypothetical protein V8F20_005080 [Naviculisporaceae sp. PSN 640]
MLFKTQILQTAALLLPLLDLAAANCWENKCSRPEISSTILCAPACREKGYPVSDYETYYRIWPLQVAVVCTCGTFRSFKPSVCSSKGLPYKETEQKSAEYFAGKIPKC